MLHLILNVSDRRGILVADWHGMGPVPIMCSHVPQVFWELGSHHVSVHSMAVLCSPWLV